MHLESADKALLLTRLSSDSEVSKPVAGMIFYDESLKCFVGYTDSNEWIPLHVCNSKALDINCASVTINGIYRSGTDFDNSNRIEYTLTNITSSSLTNLDFSAPLTIDSGTTGVTYTYTPRTGNGTNRPSDYSNFDLAAGASIELHYILEIDGSDTAPAAGGDITVDFNDTSFNLSCSETIEVTEPTSICTSGIGKILVTSGAGVTMTVDCDGNLLRKSTISGLNETANFSWTGGSSNDKDLRIINLTPSQTENLTNFSGSASISNINVCASGGTSGTQIYADYTGYIRFNNGNIECYLRDSRQNCNGSGGLAAPVVRTSNTCVFQ
jgi:hypothetical protein